MANFNEITVDFAPTRALNDGSNTTKTAKMTSTRQKSDDFIDFPLYHHFSSLMAWD